MRLYEYVDLVRVIDGDTVVLDFDLGFHIHYKLTARLLGINAPDVRDGRELKSLSTSHLTELLKVLPIVCRTHKDKQGKYGRYLVQLSDNRGMNINEAMVLAGHAARYPVVK